ncbi:hypothetical protein C8Q79DRAFT_924268 [Trametes meyenii]|nr:hypothetical protein C8Q79DRAFT_924268 [Trametes meyenii]
MTLPPSLPPNFDSETALTSLPSTIPALDSTFGAILLGTCFGLMLYGLTVHQSYQYFRLYPNDIPVLKILVFPDPSSHVFCGYPVALPMAIVLALWKRSTRCSVFTCGNISVLLVGKVSPLMSGDSYYYFTTNYFNPIALLSGIWSLRLIPIVTGSVIFVCHGLDQRLDLGIPRYINESSIQGGLYKIIIVVVVAVMMLGELGFVAASTAEAFIQPSFASWSRFTDSLVVDLSRLWLRSRGRPATHKYVDLRPVSQSYGVQAVLQCLVPDISYANSVLAVLNTRRSLSERRLAELDAGTFGMNGLDTESMRRVVPSGHAADRLEVG